MYTIILLTIIVYFPVLHRSYLYKDLGRFYFLLPFPLNLKEALTFWRHAGKNDF